MISDEVSAAGFGWNTGSNSDEMSNFLDSSCWEEVLDEEVDVVGAAGAVELVTI
jgi:hypothetical protein